MNVEFEFCSLHYLNQWLRVESHFCASIESPDSVTRLEAISDAAKHFKIARNLPVAHENGKGRYTPVLKLIDGISLEDIRKQGYITSVERLRDKVSRAYGGRDVLSFASKILWVKIRSPVIVYDKQARQALGTEIGDYHTYCQQWWAAYEAKEEAIGRACAKLHKMRKYCVAPDLATEQYITEIAAQDWFKHRVFDIYLWHGGNAHLEIQADAPAASGSAA